VTVTQPQSTGSTPAALTPAEPEPLPGDSALPADELRSLIGSRHTLVLAAEGDEARFLGLVRGAASALGVAVWTWTATRGVAKDGFGPQYGTRPLLGALAFAALIPDPSVFVFLDAHPSLQDPTAVRAVKDAAETLGSTRTLILTAPEWVVPPELAGLAVMWTLAPPAQAELADLVSQTISTLAGRNIAVTLSADARAELVDAVRGLAASDAERLIQQAALQDGKLDDADVIAVRGAKAQLLEGSSPLEIVDTSGTLDMVGGMDRLKRWLALRGKAMQPAGKAFGLDAPKGVLLTGVPGCGKSLVAKTLAGTWGYPLVLLDPARLYGKYVGESEGRLQRALDAVDAMAPAVLWIDEIEKGFAQGGDEDGGVGARLLGTFLRWMQDRPPGVFVVATANEVDRLPPEFLRKGRFDEIFFVDLPRPVEREAIFRLQLTRHQRDAAGFDLAALATASDGFSGAEIEAAVSAAMYQAFADGADLTTDGIVAQLRATEPLSRTRAEDIAAIRAWAHDRAVPV
jgi:AAA+ superfamily predicted ATPase